jgi:hypothetical protein
MLLQDGPVAQRLEQWTHNPLVAGSNPAGPTNFSIQHSIFGRLSSARDFVELQPKHPNSPTLPQEAEAARRSFPSERATCRDSGINP